MIQHDFAGNTCVQEVELYEKSEDHCYAEGLLSRSDGVV